MVSNRSRASWVVLTLLGALLGLGLAQAAPAHAVTVEITLTADGPSAPDLQVRPGDVVRFTVPADEAAGHRVVSTNAPDAMPNWPVEGGSYDSGPIAPGASVETPAFPAGTYTYEDQRDAVLLPPTAGRTTPGTITSKARPVASPTPKASTSPKPGASPRPTSASARPTTSQAPAPVGGGGTGVLPPLSGGVALPPVPSAGPGLGPQVAPTLPGEELPSAAPPAEEQGDRVAARAGRLPEAPTSRLFGSLAALGAVAALGTASLLIRLLLAHPAARAPATD